MDISFIIPTYNEAKGIVDTVQQFKALRHPRHELIVSDNGSTDTTGLLTRPLVDKLITLPSDMRTTIGECRNRGARAALGDIFWFLDADVRIINLEATADEVVHYFQTHPQTVAVVLKFGIYQSEATRSDRFWFVWVNTANFAQNRVLKTGASSGDCMIVRRSVFERIHGFNPTLVTSEDHDLYHRLAKQGDIAMLWHRRTEMSPRRFRQDGWGKVFWQWERNWIRQFVFRKSDTGVWEPRR